MSSAGRRRTTRHGLRVVTWTADGRRIIRSYSDEALTVSYFIFDRECSMTGPAVDFDTIPCTRRELAGILRTVRNEPTAP